MLQQLASTTALVAFLASNSYAVENGLAITPQMGWLSLIVKKVLLDSY